MPYKDVEKQKAYQRCWIADRRSKFFSDKECSRCGANEGLELDHKDPTQKVTHRIWSWSAQRRDLELAKCQVLCEACHLAKTVIYRDGHAPYQHGTISMYKTQKCRCSMCRAENARVVRLREASVKETVV